MRIFKIIKEIIRQNELILELKLDTREKRDAHGITVYTWHCPLCPHPGECPKETCELYPCNEGYTYPKDFNDLKEIEKRLRYWKLMLTMSYLITKDTYRVYSKVADNTIRLSDNYRNKKKTCHTNSFCSLQIGCIYCLECNNWY